MTEAEATRRATEMVRTGEADHAAAAPDPQDPTRWIVQYRTAGVEPRERELR